MKQIVRIMLSAVAGLVGIAVFYEVLSHLLPPVLPSAHAASHVISSPRVKPRAKNRKVQKVVSSPVVLPGGLAPVSYLPVQEQNILSLAKSLQLSPLLPKLAFPGTALEESYASGQELDLEFNNMLAVESKTPIDSYYRPAASTALVLSNGVPADWLLVYGIGGPMHRLMFQEDGIYVRLELFNAYVPATMAATEKIAAEFLPLKSVVSPS